MHDDALGVVNLLVDGLQPLLEQHLLAELVNICLGGPLQVCGEIRRVDRLEIFRLEAENLRLLNFGANFQIRHPIDLSLWNSRGDSTRAVRVLLVDIHAVSEGVHVAFTKDVIEAGHLDGIERLNYVLVRIMSGLPY